MKLGNTPTSFGLISKFFHWIMAVLVLMLLMIGYRMEMMESVDRVFVMFYHKSFGVLVLILIAARLLWRIVSPRPGRLPTIKVWEDKLATLVHFLLYAAIFAMPISGWVMSSAGEYPVSFFGLFTLPQIVPKNPDIMQAARNAHGVIATAILVLLFLHLSGAAKHHVIDRDDTLRRMTWNKMGYLTGFVVLAFGAILYLMPISAQLAIKEEPRAESAVEKAAESVADLTTAPLVPDAVVDDAHKWNVDPANSVIKFKASQSGQEFEGEFKNFTAEIIFDPETVTGKIDVRVPIANFSTGSSERDTEVQKVEWFDAAQFPEARFTAESFHHVEYSEYVAYGTLTIRGVSKPAELNFNLARKVENGTETADVEGSLSLNRLDYGIGQGAWQKTDMIADSVGIAVYVKASRPVPAEKQ